jgi:hypothetical protein
VLYRTGCAFMMLLLLLLLPQILPAASFSAIDPVTEVREGGAGWLLLST